MDLASKEEKKMVSEEILTIGGTAQTESRAHYLVILWVWGHRYESTGCSSLAWLLQFRK